MSSRMQIAGVEVPEDVIAFVGEALASIAASCDGAKQQDNQGFSKAHAGYGKMLAMLPADVVGREPDTFEASAHVLMHYPRQVKQWVGDLDEHPEWQWLIKHVAAGNSYKKLPEGRIVVTPDETSPLGVSAQLFLRNKQAFESLDEFALMATAIDAYEHDDGHRFRFSATEHWPLLASMIASGLRRALTEDVAVMDDLESRMTRAVDRGDLPLSAAVDTAASDPVVIAPDIERLKQGKVALSLYSPYDPRLVSLCRKFGGRWNRDGPLGKCWDFLPKDEAALERLIKGFDDSIGLRPAYLYATDWQAQLDAEVPRYDGYHQPMLSEEPDESRRMLGPLAGLFALAAERAPEQAQPDVEAGVGATDPEGPRGRLIRGDQGRVIARIHLPFDYRDLKEELKPLGARFDWDVKEWYLPVNETNLQALKKVGLYWETPLDTFFAEHELPPFGYLDLEGEHLIRMNTPYHSGLVEFVRTEIPRVDKEFHGTSKTWSFRAATPELVEKVKQLMVDYRLKLRYPGRPALSDAEAETVLDDMAAQLSERLDMSYVADSNYTVDGFNLEPFPFQKAGMAYIKDFGNTLVGDDCGLGKTPQGIGGLLDHDAFPALVVCPAIGRLTWEEEFKKFTDRVAPEEIVVLGVGTARQKKLATEKAEHAKVVIINYEILRKHVDLLSRIPFRGGILDESHYIKNPKAQRTEAAATIMDNPSMVLKLLLSATPYLNRPSELIPQLKVLDKLEAVGGERYLKRLDNAGKQGLEALNRRLRATCMIRREKREVWQDMPAVLVSRMPCEADKDYLRAEEELAERLIYPVLKQADKSTLTRIAAGIARGDDGWAGLIAGRGLANAQGGMDGVDFTEMSALRRKLGMAKVPSVLEWLRNFRDSTPAEDKLVIFAYHKGVQEALYEGAEALGMKPARLVGGQDPAVRKREERRFQEGDARVCVASMKAARENVTLTAGSHCMFAEQDYSGGVMIQCRDRLIRISQQNATVNVHFATMRDSLDVNMVEAVQDKMAKITQGLGDLNAQDGLSEESSQGAFTALVQRYQSLVESCLAQQGVLVPWPEVSPTGGKRVEATEEPAPAEGMAPGAPCEAPAVKEALARAGSRPLAMGDDPEDVPPALRAPDTRQSPSEERRPAQEADPEPAREPLIMPASHGFTRPFDF